SAETINKMWTGIIPTPYCQGENPMYCLGWEREDDFLNTTLMTHGGNIVVSSNAMMILPEKNIALSLGQNIANSTSDSMARGVLAILLGEDPETVNPEIRIMKKINAILGSYEDHNATNVEFAMEGPSLVLIEKSSDGSSVKSVIVPIDLDNLKFKIASPLPQQDEIAFFEDAKKNEIFVKLDRNLFFKK
ncbi:MAG: hypothetical protein KAR20_26070, partial [Candidatus Heimdallarchaeota archaeon]|nr:hypothetical protein [Candidatus Heimdallarchaeota archaeon]